MRGTPDVNLWLRQRPRGSKYGAPLGRANRDDASPGLRRYCQRIRFEYVTE